MFQPIWWRHKMETYSGLLPLCAGNWPVTGEIRAQRPVTRSFDVCKSICFQAKMSYWWATECNADHRASEWKVMLLFLRQGPTQKDVCQGWLNIIWTSASHSIKCIHGNVVCEWFISIPIYLTVSQLGVINYPLHVLVRERFCHIYDSLS